MLTDRRRSTSGRTPRASPRASSISHCSMSFCSTDASDPAQRIQPAGKSRTGLSAQSLPCSSIMRKRSRMMGSRCRCPRRTLFGTLVRKRAAILHKSVVSLNIDTEAVRVRNATREQQPRVLAPLQTWYAASQAEYTKSETCACARARPTGTERELTVSGTLETD